MSGISILPLGADPIRLRRLQDQLEAAIARGDDLGPRGPHIQVLIAEISASVQALGWLLIEVQFSEEADVAISRLFCGLLETLAPLEELASRGSLSSRC